ncbi:MAG: DUF111 family protein, partial [Coriobacteriaceae bacterium]|nr:DUF111 family protein [Coriobacteriaceae bacterium]
MAKTLYLECTTGIAGDMLVAALLDLGADGEGLRAALATLPLEGYEVRISRVMAGALAACDFDVVLDHDHENHDHDMAWLYPDEGHGAHDHEHHHHHREHHHHHHHEHRGLAECLAIIDGSELPDGAKAIAERTFSILADAEAKAHGTTPDEVHFHEVGAVDSI